MQPSTFEHEFSDSIAFPALFPTSCCQAVAYEYNTEFSAFLSERSTFYSSDSAADTITRVKV